MSTNQTLEKKAAESAESGSQRGDDPVREEDIKVKLDDVNEPSASDNEAEKGDTTEKDDSSMNRSFQSAQDGGTDSQSIGNNPSDSNAPNSSRGSTRDTQRDDDTYSLESGDRGRVFGGADPRYRRAEGEDESPEREEDGSVRLTNRWLKELFKKEWKKYYRTPELNEKLFLHYHGFSYLKNMSQFVNLKCLYFEGNGCRSMKGLEKNLEMRSLFLQENIIEKMEGMDTLKDLR